jgi:hypothetical protein
MKHSCSNSCAISDRKKFKKKKERNLHPPAFEALWGVDSTYKAKSYRQMSKYFHCSLSYLARRWFVQPAAMRCALPMLKSEAFIFLVLSP